MIEAAAPAPLRRTLLQVAVLLAGVSIPVCSLVASPRVVLAGLILTVGSVLALRYPAVLFCALAFSVPWSSALMASQTITTTDFIVAAIGFVWLARAAHEHRSPLVPVPWTLPVVVFVAALCLSVTQAVDLAASAKEVIKWVELLVVYQAGVQLVPSRRLRWWIFLSLMGAGISQAALGYLQSALTLGPSAFVHGQFLRAYGTFDQPNPYAGYLNMILPLSLSHALLRKQWRAPCVCASAVVLGALVLSESRGALLGTLLAATLVAGAVIPRLRTLVGGAAVAGLAGSWLATFGLVPTSPFLRLLDAVGLGGVAFGHVTNANFSAVERAAHWLAGVRMFASHPLFGVGVGNYAAAYPAFHPRGWYAPLAHAHNYYINVAAECGIVGLVAYGLLAGLALWYAYAAYKGSSDAFGRATALGVLGALTATDFHNLFDVLYVHGMVTLLGVLMVLAVTAAPHERWLHVTATGDAL